MDAAVEPTIGALNALGQFGIAGIVFVIWYFDSKNVGKLQEVVKEQIEDKRMMREERAELIRVVREMASLMQSVRDTNERMAAAVDNFIAHARR